MHLVPCAPPLEPLVAAPRTALLSDSAVDAWDGFWSESSDAYYVRCTRGDESVEWFTLADEADPADGRLAGGDARVLGFPARSRPVEEPRAVAFLARSPAGRGMLVGTTRRREAPERASE